MKQNTERCILCGATQNLTWDMKRVSDHKHVKVRRCIDTAACWERWNEQVGLTAKLAEVA